MFFSVVIPTCNRSILLKSCLDSLYYDIQELSENIYEVIVSDDGKSDETRLLIEEKYSWVKWVQGPRRGPAANRNNGAKHANGEWLVFIDDDVLPKKDLLKNYFYGINRNPQSIAFEGAILPDDWELLKKDMAECPVNVEGGCFWSANICIQRELFNKIEGFNEKFLLAAQEDQQMKIDVENTTRMSIVFLRDCEVIHPVRFTTVIKQVNKMGSASRNFVLFAKWNQTQLNYKSTIDFGVKQFEFHLIRTLRAIKSGKLKNALVSFIWLVYGVPLNIFNFYQSKLK